MTKILIGEISQKFSTYFVLNYTFYIPLPTKTVECLQKCATQIATITAAKTLSEVTEPVIDTVKEFKDSQSFANGTSIEEIQKKLEELYKEKEQEICVCNKLDFYGLSWDGEAWK